MPRGSRPSRIPIPRPAPSITCGATHLSALYETPALTTSGADSGTRFQKAKKLIDRTLAKGCTLLTEIESTELLSLYGIPSVPTRVARTADQATACAAQFGYPAVLKVYSETITHKTDVGGVKLNREMALVAELTDPDTRSTCIAAVPRLSRALSAEEAEIGVIVADKFQHQGLGAELIKRLIDIARIEKVKRIVRNFIPKTAPSGIWPSTAVRP